MAGNRFINPIQAPQYVNKVSPIPFDQLMQFGEKRKVEQEQGLSGLSKVIDNVAGMNYAAGTTDEQVVKNNIMPAVQQVADKYKNANWSDPLTKFKMSQDLRNAAPPETIKRIQENAANLNEAHKQFQALASKGEADPNDWPLVLQEYNKANPNGGGVLDPTIYANIDHTDKLYNKYYSSIKPSLVTDPKNPNRVLTDNTGHSIMQVDDKTLQSTAMNAVNNERGSVSYNDIVKKARRDDPSTKDLSNDQIVYNQLYNISKQKLQKGQGDLNAVMMEQMRENADLEKEKAKQTSIYMPQPMEGFQPGPSIDEGTKNMSEGLLKQRETLSAQLGNFKPGTPEYNGVKSQLDFINSKFDDASKRASTQFTPDVDAADNELTDRLKKAGFTKKDVINRLNEYKNPSNLEKMIPVLSGPMKGWGENVGANILSNLSNIGKQLGRLIITPPGMPPIGLVNLKDTNIKPNDLDAILMDYAGKIKDVSDKRWNKTKELIDGGASKSTAINTMYAPSFDVKDEFGGQAETTRPDGSKVVSNTYKILKQIQGNPTGFAISNLTDPTMKQDKQEEFFKNAKINWQSTPEKTDENGPYIVVSANNKDKKGNNTTNSYKVYLRTPSEVQGVAEDYANTGDMRTAARVADMNRGKESIGSQIDSQSNSSTPTYKLNIRGKSLELNGKRTPDGKVTLDVNGQPVTFNDDIQLSNWLHNLQFNKTYSQE